MWRARIARRTMGEFPSFLISDMNNHLTNTATLPANGFAVPGNSEPKFQQPSSLKSEQKSLESHRSLHSPKSPQKYPPQTKICASSSEEGKWGSPLFNWKRKENPSFHALIVPPPFPLSLLPPFQLSTSHFLLPSFLFFIHLFFLHFSFIHPLSLEYWSVVR